ncbi:MAG: HAD-IIIA family hydrolase [Clostridiales bacterium]|nr:HAD-IIIA family hydrolase [Clostridiales bacterium]
MHVFFLGCKPLTRLEKICYTLRMIRAILFDRDGTLGELSDKRYPQTFTPFVDIEKIFNTLKKRGYLVGIITNQASIARGTGRDYDFEKEFLSYGVNAWAICPHDTADNCECRKPKSGLLLAVAKKLGVAPCECLVVGDRLSDIQCALHATARAVLVETGYGKAEKETVLSLYPAIPVLSRFDDILDYLNQNA